MENENYYKKIENRDIIEVKKGDILISSVRPYLKKFIYIDEEKSNVYFTKAFLHIRPKRSSLYLYFLLRTYFLDNLLSITRIGKGYPTLSVNDLENIIFQKDRLDYFFSKEREFNLFIKDELKLINKYKKSTDEQRLIDTKFKDLFDWNYKKFKELRDIKIINRKLSYINKNSDLRISSKFNNHVIDFVEEEIWSKSNGVKLKNCITEPIILGNSISPSDYNTKNKKGYISMASIKDWRLDSSNIKGIKDNYYIEMKNKGKLVKKNDILMARSGEGTIGKVAIVDEDIDAVFADFIIRIRMNDKYNVKFIYYFFKTTYFQYLIDAYKKGLGNNTNIFPSAIKEFPIPNVDIQIQKEVVMYLDEKISDRKIYKSLIEELDKKFMNTI